MGLIGFHSWRLHCGKSVITRACLRYPAIPGRPEQAKKKKKENSIPTVHPGDDSLRAGRPRWQRLIEHIATGSHQNQSGQGGGEGAEVQLCGRADSLEAGA